MKIALCIFGRAMYLEQSYLNLIKNSLTDQDTLDIYIHMWWDDGVYLNADSCKRNVKLSDDTIGNIIKIYKPCKILIENQKKFDLSLYKLKGTNSENRVSQFYSMHKAYSLIEEQNIPKYDWIIMTRFDAVFRSYITKIDFTKMNKNHVYTAYIHKQHSNNPCSMFEVISGVLSHKFFGKFFSNLDEIENAEDMMRKLLYKEGLILASIPFFTSFYPNISFDFYNSLYISHRPSYNGLSPPFNID